MNMKQFHEYEYDVYALLASSKDNPVWRWENWEKITNILNPFFATLGSDFAVRSTQLDITNKNKPVSFGRLSWNEKSHEKWTHASPVTGGESSKWHFLDVEVWSPSWNESVRLRRAPQCFLKITNRNLSYLRERRLSFDTVILCALSRDTGDERLLEFRKTMIRLSHSLDSRLTVYRKRMWGVSWDASGFTKSLQDLPNAGLLKTGPVDEGEIRINILDESSEWQLLS